MSSYKYNGVCVFDIDGTLKPYACADEHKEYKQDCVRRLLHMCESHGYGIAINTARRRMSSRLRKYLNDEVGIDVDALPMGAVQLNAKSPNRKVQGLAHIQEVYNIPNKSQILFFDDNKRNVESADKHGYAALRVARQFPFGCTMISPAEEACAQRYFGVGAGKY